MKGKTSAKSSSNKTSAKSGAKSGQSDADRKGSQAGGGNQEQSNGQSTAQAAGQSMGRTAQAGQAAAAGGEQDPIKLLKADHRKVEELFEKYENTEQQDEKAKIAQQVCQELIAHTALEEEIFYPSCRQSGVEDDTMDEAQVEHDGAKILINELMTQEPGDEFYNAKFKVLSEYVKHHVREEEKSDGIFAKAKQAGMDMSALGQRIATRKQELTAEIEAMSLEPSPVRSLQSIDRQQYRYDQEEDTMPRNSNNRERDEQGRFMSDDDRGYSRGSSRSSRSRYEDEDDRGGRSGSRGEYASRGRDDDDDRSGSRGEYASRGRDDDDDRGGRGSSRSEYSSRGRDDDDDRGGRGRSGGRSQGGWFGDSEGHSEAARRGWERGDHGESGWFGDREGHSEASRRGWERGDHGESGWFGDSEGHSEAARRGWEHGHRGQGGGESRGGNSRGGYSSRSRYESGSDDDRGGRGRSGNGGGNGGNGGGGSSRGRSHGGWFGDSEGHSEASRRGWRNRD